MLCAVLMRPRTRRRVRGSQFACRLSGLCAGGTRWWEVKGGGCCRCACTLAACAAWDTAAGVRITERGARDEAAGIGSAACALEVCSMALNMSMEVGCHTRRLPAATDCKCLHRNRHKGRER